MSHLTTKSAWNKGLKGYYKHSEEAKERIRQSKLGDKNPMKNSEVVKKAILTRAKNPVRYWLGKKRDMPWLPKFEKGHGIQNTGRTRFKEGELHPRWKGGTKQRGLSTAIYRAWRTAVFTRDSYTCQMCRQTGGYLEADHIKRWADYPELRFELSNGRTLCYGCHKKITFGKEIYVASY